MEKLNKQIRVNDEYVIILDRSEDEIVYVQVVCNGYVEQQAEYEDIWEAKRYINKCVNNIKDNGYFNELEAVEY